MKENVCLNCKHWGANNKNAIYDVGISFCLKRKQYTWGNQRCRKFKKEK